MTKNLRQGIYCALVLFLSVNAACKDEQKGTHSTTDTDAAAGSVKSPTAATSSAGGGGMGGATSTHALASDTIAPDSAHQK